MRPPPKKLLIFLSQFTLLYPFLYSISHFLGPRGPLLLPMVANDYLEDLASWKWSSRGSCLVQMFIRRIQPFSNDHWRIWRLANDHPEDPALCKWSSWGSRPLKMMIRRIRPLANEHLEGPAIFKWSFGGSDVLQMIIRRIRPLANDDPEDPATWKWSSVTTVTLVTSPKIQILYRGYF